MPFAIVLALTMRLDAPGAGLVRALAVLAYLDS